MSRSHNLVKVPKCYKNVLKVGLTKLVEHPEIRKHTENGHISNYMFLLLKNRNSKKKEKV